MSLPINMKTGKILGKSHENILPETFHIIYFILFAILRRNGYKDSILYSKHNNKLHNQKLFDSGILFNLKSKYGVGSSLISLIIELFTTIKLDPYTHKHNVFFKEIVRLTTEVSRLKHLNNPKEESYWITNYAVNMESVIDDISRERNRRLYELLVDPPIPMDISEDSDNGDECPMDISEEDMLGNDYIKCGDKCMCLFCYEFRKYNNNTNNKNISTIIDDILLSITKTLY